MRSRVEAAAASYTEGDKGKGVNKGERDGINRPFYIISLIDDEKTI